MNIPVSSKEALDLFHQGSLVYAQIEGNGIKVNEKYLDEALEKTAKDIARLESELKKDEIWKRWEGKYKTKANIDSDVQLGKIIFEDMKYECPLTTEKTGRYSCTEAAFADIDLPFIKTYFKAKK